MWVITNHNELTPAGLYGIMYIQLARRPGVPLRVDPDTLIPLYYQIREQLRQQILSGVLQPGDLLPSETQICAECGVSRMTARMALTQLANEGLVVRQRGRGTFVAPPKATFHEIPFSLSSYTEIVGRLGLRAGAQIRSQEVVPAPPPLAAQLRIAVGDPVVRIERVRSASGEVMSLEVSCYPHSRFPALAEHDLTDRSIYRVLEELYGVVPAYGIDTIELSVAGPYEANELNIKEGMPIVLCSRASYSEQDVPIEFTQTIHRGDRFRSVVRCSREQLLECSEETSVQEDER